MAGWFPGAGAALLRRAVLMIAGAAVLLAPAAAAAQGLIRDPDIEHGLRELARPVLAEAGLSPAQVRVLLVDDRRLNAFVIDGRHIFLTTGLMLRLASAAEMQAVIAHEAAHIANGHITRRISNLDNARTAAAMGVLIALAVGAASGRADAAGGLATGIASSAMGVFLSHTRAEESSADQAAVRYLVRAGIDPAAMLRVLEVFRGQEALSEGRQDPYVRTHPLTRDRIRALEGFAAAAAGGGGRGGDTAAYWYARAHGKLSAFVNNPAATLRAVRADDRSDAALIRRAVAHHRQADLGAALAAIDALIARRPEDPYAHELRGQILLESRQFAAAAQAYGRAAALAPGEPLMLAGQGRALLAIGTPDSERQALTVLEAARARDQADPRLLRDLAVAYAKAGNAGMASVVTAERYALAGRMEDAALHARRAEGLLARGTPGWNRAQDVLRAAEAVENRRRRG
ncbi:MAG: M48 family metalloprotease [Rhodobacteraceae bacterium]|nr:M48 family metalloprotease [Paracoccaceae bacterium]